LRQYYFAKKLQSQIVIIEKLHKTLLYEKAAIGEINTWQVSTFTPRYVTDANF